MRALAMTGIVTAALMPSISAGSAMRATPPSERMSAGTRSRAMTATAPDSSAMPACSAVVTSMITPPFSISARPPLTRIVPSSAMAPSVARALRPQAIRDGQQVVLVRREAPDHRHVAETAEDVLERDALRREALVRLRHARRVLERLAEGEDDDVVRGELG